MDYKVDYLNRLRNRVSIRQFINYDLPVNRHSRSAFQCPLCLNSLNRLLINDNQLKFVCFDCKKTGDVFEYVQLTQGVNFDRALEIIADVSAELYLTQIPHTVKEISRIGRWQTNAH